MELFARFILHISHSRSTTGEGAEGVGEYMKAGTQWERGGGHVLCISKIPKGARYCNCTPPPPPSRPAKAQRIRPAQQITWDNRSDFVVGGIFEVTEITQRLTRGNVL